VAAGMVMAAELSVRAGLLEAADAARLRALVIRAGLPAKGPSLALERYLELMMLDKKAAGGRMRFILLERIGRAVMRGDVDERLVRDTLAAGATPASAAAAR